MFIDALPTYMYMYLLSTVYWSPGLLLIHDSVGLDSRKLGLSILVSRMPRKATTLPDMLWVVEGVIFSGSSVGYLLSCTCQTGHSVYSFPADES